VGGPLEILTKLYDFLFGRLDLFTGGGGKIEKSLGGFCYSPPSLFLDYQKKFL